MHILLKMEYLGEIFMTNLSFRTSDFQLQLNDVLDVVRVNKISLKTPNSSSNMPNFLLLKTFISLSQISVMELDDEIWELGEGKYWR